MKLSNYLYLLTSIVMINAQDDMFDDTLSTDNTSSLDDNLTTTSLTTTSLTTGTSSLDDSLSTGISSLDDSLSRITSVTKFDDSEFRVSIGNKNVLGYNILLWGFLFL